MLKHCVFVQFRDNVPAKDKQRVLAGFGDLVSQVDGMEDYAWGPNRDFEDKSGRYGDGFVVTFRDREAHLRYPSNYLPEEFPMKVWNEKGSMQLC